MKTMIMTIISIMILSMPFVLASENDSIKAPDFALKNYNGKVYKLSDFQGKIVVLEWMNYECPFSKYHYEDASTMKDLAAKYKDKEVIWLSINSTSHLEVDKNKEFAKKHGIEYPILDDHLGIVGKAYGATNTPHMFIIDKDGNIAYKGTIDNAPMGKNPLSTEYINYVDNALEELVAGKKVTLSSTKANGCTVKYKK